MFELKIVEENSEIAQKYLEKRNEISQSQYHLCNDSFHGKDLFYSKIKLAIADFNNFDELGCPLSNNLMEFKHIMRFATRDSSKLIIFIGELHYDGFIFLIQSNIKHKKIEWINNNYLESIIDRN